MWFHLNVLRKQKHDAGLKHLHIAAVLKLEWRFWPVMFLLCLLCCELKIRPSYLRAGYNRGLALSSKSDTVLAAGKVSLLMGLAQIISVFRQMMDTTVENRGEKYGEKNEASVPFLTSITKHIYIFILSWSFLTKATVIPSLYDFLFSVEHKRRCSAECPSCSFTSIAWKRAAWTLC